MVDYSDGEGEPAAEKQGGEQGGKQHDAAAPQDLKQVHLSGSFPSFCKVDVTPYFTALKLRDEYHITLSANFQLAFHQINPFVSALKRKLDKFNEFLCCPFPKSEKLYNERKQQEYHVVLFDVNRQGLIELSEAVQNVIQKFDHAYERLKILPHVTLKQREMTLGFEEIALPKAQPLRVSWVDV